MDTAETGDRQLIHCLHCRRPQYVPARALTLTCKFCNKLLKVEAVSITQYHARRVIETCGCLTVEKDGNVFTDRILCGALVARGKIKGNVLSFGPVLIAPHAQLRGDVTAPSLCVGEGAVLEGNYTIGGAISDPLESTDHSGNVSHPPPSAL